MVRVRRVMTAACGGVLAAGAVGPAPVTIVGLRQDSLQGDRAIRDILAQMGARIEATDEAIGIIFEACKSKGVTLFITSDHGNAEKMCSEDGKPHTAHTCAPVPFICSDKNVTLMRDGSLCDVAPTILKYMNVSIPEEMTGKSLIKHQ